VGEPLKEVELKRGVVPGGESEGRGGFRIRKTFGVGGEGKGKDGRRVYVSKGGRGLKKGGGFKPERRQT